MKVLVTGGSGVIGRAAINALLAEGHEVRLLARRAHEAVREWERGVEPFAGDVAQDGALDGAAEGCDAVLHIAGIASEEPPERTFEGVNVRGTERMLTEAARAGATRFVSVSSLGAEHGQSDYHRSKRAAEELVRGSGLRWTIVRPGNVYGPGDGIISTLVRMIRTLPAMPVVHGSDRAFRPVWHTDLGEALARCVATDGWEGRTLDVGGPDETTVDQLIDRLESLTDRRPLRLPVPDWAARLGLRALGAHAPFPPDAITMLAEGNTLAPADNALTDLLGRAPTGLEAGLALLVDGQPEQTPDQGSGPLRRRVFTVDIEGAQVGAQALSERFRADFNRFVPIEAAAEPGASARLDVGATLTLSLPARGHVQVRVEHADAERVTLATLAGHPLAGTITFAFEERGEQVRFTVDEASRAANLVDRVAMRVLGDALQGATWTQVCERVVAEAGGSCPGGVVESDELLEGDEARAHEERVRERIAVRRREQENEAGPAPVKRPPDRRARAPRSPA